MFDNIFKKQRYKQIQEQSAKKESGFESKTQPEFSQDLKKNLDVLIDIIGSSSDIVIRRFAFGYKRKVQGAILFIDGLVDKTLINESIMRPLMYDSRLNYTEEALEAENIDSVKTILLSVGDVEQLASMSESIDSFLSGDTILLIDGSKDALVINSRNPKTRNIEEPVTEAVVRGPREGFSETLRFNTALLRRKIKNPDLILESLKIGVRTKTDICIAYINGLANPLLVEEVRRRLKRINTDAILDSGYIEQYIEDAPFSIFSTVANSEKPDKVAAKLMEGRVAIMVDGSPFALTVPMVFIESFQSTEDYYSRPFFASVIRAFRFLGYLISILAPALYVALSTFHQELIPTPLLLTMAAAREGVPFPAVLEAGIMIVIFEILREAGVRLPRTVGQAVSIVGALVIGEAAVSAGLIGAPMVIIIAVTAVSSFVIPPQTDSGVILRFVLLILAGFMGGFGIAIGLLGFFIHLASLRSFGTPYLSPLAPLNLNDLKDVFIRAPIWAMIKRPGDIAWHDEQKQEFRLKPGPPRGRRNMPKD